MPETQLRWGIISQGNQALEKTVGEMDGILETDQQEVFSVPNRMRRKEWPAGMLIAS